MIIPAMKSDLITPAISGLIVSHSKDLKTGDSRLQVLNKTIPEKSQPQNDKIQYLSLSLSLSPSPSCKNQDNPRDLRGGLVR